MAGNRIWKETVKANWIRARSSASSTLMMMGPQRVAHLGAVFGKQSPGPGRVSVAVWGNYKGHCDGGATVRTVAGVTNCDNLSLRGTRAGESRPVTWGVTACRREGRPRLVLLRGRFRC
ncbi:hypothetical protein D3C81_1399820 [compost metagenome]